jgi:hypothetical protein
VITGRVVSEDGYMEETARVFARASGNDQEDVRVGMEGWFGRTAAKREDPPRHLHLANAKIIRGLGGPITLPTWRGALDAIVGFSLGGLDV